jgi:Raf kinase inhibitor-like YbhB/YbcL family protein
MRRRLTGLIVVSSLLIFDVAGAQQERPMPFGLSSSSFPAGARILAQYTCDDADLSLPLVWSDPPAGTKSLALIMDDPDAPRGTWVHWVVYNLPPTSRGLTEGLPQDPKLDDGGLQGVNDFGRVGYGGPCPPPGAPHRYVFKLYALDTTLTLPPRATKAQLERAMNGHILEEARLIGRYQR